MIAQRCFGSVCWMLLTTLPVSAAASASTPLPTGRTYSVLYTFGSQTGDGVGPVVYTHDKAGNLYGSTLSGGAHNAGTIFRFAPDGTETILYSFCSRKNCTDGKTPHGSLAVDKKGNLYGTTESGGKSNNGVVFEIRQIGVERVLYSFTGGNDGGEPVGGVSRDGAGNLFGTTMTGGDSTHDGVVFELAANGTYSVLHSFGGGDGATPESPLIIDKQGNLYGTTDAGGTDNFGTVFEVASDGTETALYSFSNGSDGGQPVSGLIMDASGNLFGTTLGGGNGGCFFGVGCGVVFKLSPDGIATTLYAFQGGSDGGNPIGALTADAEGDLFGTAEFEGKGSCFYGSGCGTIFEIVSDGREKTLYMFSGGADGGNPGGVIWDPVVQKRTLYGGAFSGGAYGDGVSFSLTR